MRTSARNTLLKLISLAAVIASVYPAVFTARFLIFNAEGGYLTHISAAAFVLGGFFASKAIIRDDSKIAHRLAESPAADFLFFMFGKRPAVRTVCLLCAYMTLVVPIGVSAVVYSRFGIWRLLFEAAAALLFFAFGLRCHLAEYFSILGKQRVIAGGVLVTATLLRAHYHPWLSRFSPWFYLGGCLFALVSMLVHNQRNLDYNIFSKKYINISDTVLRRIRKTNALAVVLLFLAVLLFFNLKNVVIYLLQIAGAILKGLVWLFFELIALLMPDPAGPGSGGVEQPNLLPPAETAGPNLLLETAFKVIFCAAVAYLIYRIGPAAFRSFIRAAAKLLSRIGGLLQRLFALSEAECSVETGDFMDEVEEVKPAKKRLQYAEKLYRRGAGKWGGGKDPAARVRHSYRITVVALKAGGIPVAASETAREILGKTSEIPGMGEHFEKLTDIYEKVRYGLRMPGRDEAEEAEQSCRVLLVLTRGRPPVK